MFTKEAILGSRRNEMNNYFTTLNVYSALGAFIIFTVVKVIYRLYLSPLSNIPGRKLAAATHLYPFYHDVIRRGLYIWEIEDMHRQYGPIVRISPNEIHVNDPKYIDKIFTGPGKRRDKGQMTVNGLNPSPTAIATSKHDLHRSRRAALNPFFSKQNIRLLEPTIVEVLERIFRRLDQHLEENSVVNMSLLFRAATHDIISDYAFGQGFDCLDRQDLNEPYFHAYHELVLTWHFGCYFPWVGNLMRKLPPYIVAVLVPSASHFINLIKGAVDKINQIQSSTALAEETQTIFHGLLQSTLPESEKRPARLAEEAGVLISAGTDSTANTIATITYHLLVNPLKLQRLRAELLDSIPKGSSPTFAQIEALPYLSAVIQEGLRLYPAVSARQERVAPDEDLFYINESTHTTYKIPAGICIAMTPVLLSRLPELYPSPGEFRPERFLEDPNLKRHQLTFSRGTRICLGINLAYQEMYMLLAGLFRRYDAWDESREQKSLALQLFQTTREDVDIARDIVTENVRADSQGVRLMVRRPEMDI